MLPYIGGKYLQSKWMEKYTPRDYNKYAEVFGGAFWMYLRTGIYKNVEIAYYNDINKFMVNMFKCITHKDYVKELKKVKSQDEETFMKSRDSIIEFQNSDEQIDFPCLKLGVDYPYVLSQIFSGQVITENIKMFSMKGKYTSKYDTFIKRVQNKEIQQKMKKVKVSNLDYKDFIREVDSEDMFFYVDPPYFELEDYYTFNTFFDHNALAEELKKIKGKFMLSYYDFEGLSNLFPKDEFTWVEKEYSKRAGVKSNKTTPKGKEILIMNYSNDLDEW